LCGEIIVAKVLFWCDNGANIHSRKERLLDMEDAFNITPAKWRKMSEDERWDLAYDWATSQLDFGFREVND
jgi:hypothetical protein